MRVAINGLGRIGRAVFREALGRGLGSEIVVMNDLMDPQCLANLIKYDSIHRTLDVAVELNGDEITVDGNKIKAITVKGGTELPWRDMGIDVVIESTGIFRNREEIEWHLKQGAKKAILTVPPKDKVDAMIVLGINDDDYTGEEKIVSMASCTTNCAAPVLKVIQDEFGIKRATFNTIHAYTNDQSLFDFPHKDRRRSRAAQISMIPTTTGAAKAIGPIIPELDGKIDGFAVRVPVPDGSMVDFTIDLSGNAVAEEINEAVKKASETNMKGILSYCDDPIVSVDIIGNKHSSIFDSLMTRVFDGNMLKVLSWYDNEIGYANRVVDMM